jgi:50S ribosomal protein L16 3-hydroxylase
VARRAPPPIEIDARAHPPLGMAPDVFLRDYWQKRPLLIRHAFDDFALPITPEDLAGLACEDGVLSRIVMHETGASGTLDQWLLRHGPFPEELFPGLPPQDWTLLVQDVDKWDADVAALLPAFDFLPRWRIDDIMVSFAAPGGSVGAHVDQYDVFLLQGLGRRRWQVDTSPDPDLAFRADTELKLLARFQPTHDWILEPGDMLYLPPGVPHHGVAQDACLTFSIGMRAPAASELLGDFVDELIAQSDDAQRYADPDLAPTTDPDEIDAAALRRVLDALNALRMNDPERLGDWFGRFITQYRTAAEIVPPAELPPRIRIEWTMEHGGRLLRHPWTRMAWRRSGRSARLYAGGHGLPMPVRDARRLAAAREVDSSLYAGLSQAGRDAVIALHAAGHYQLPGDETE